MEAAMLALLALIFGGVTSAFVTQVLASHRADKEYSLKKLEELSKQVNLYCQHLHNVIFNFYDLANALMAWEELAAKNKGENDALTYGEGAMESLTGIYFPDLVYPLNRLKELADSVALAGVNFRRVQSDGEKCPTELANFVKASDTLLTIQKEFQLKIYETANSIREGSVVRWLKARLDS